MKKIKYLIDNYLNDIEINKIKEKSQNLFHLLANKPCIDTYEIINSILSQKKKNIHNY